METKSHNLKDLCRLAGVTERTVRYYIKEELLPPPIGSGAFSRYSEEHRLRLQVIRQLKTEFLPLSEIKRLLAGRTVSELAELARPDQGPTLPKLNLANGLAASLRPEQPSLHQNFSREAAQPEPPRRPYGLSFQAAGHSSPEMSAPGSTRLVYQPPRFQPNELAENAPTGLGDQWERVELAPGVELHLRQPMNASRRARLEEVIETARRMLSQ